MPTTAAEAAAAPIPSAETIAQATAIATQKAGGKKPTTAAVMAQVSALQQADTIKALQHQMRALESQTKDTSVAFLATVTTLITSAFGFVAALAWNGAIQAFFHQIIPDPNGESWGLVISNFIYALIVTVIVVLIIFQLTYLNKRLGGKSLIGEVGKAEEGSKREKSKED